MTLTWSLTVKVRFAKLLRKLGGGECERQGGAEDVRSEVLWDGLCGAGLDLVEKGLEVKLGWNRAHGGEWEHVTAEC